mgnify:CR=1 FL=1
MPERDDTEVCPTGGQRELKPWCAPVLTQLAISQTQNSFIIEGPESGDFTDFIFCGDNPICIFPS